MYLQSTCGFWLYNLRKIFLEAGCFSGRCPKEGYFPSLALVVFFMLKITCTCNPEASRDIPALAW